MRAVRIPQVGRVGRRVAHDEQRPPGVEQAQNVAKHRHGRADYAFDGLAFAIRRDALNATTTGGHWHPQFLSTANFTPTSI
jgi:hypothetical protein